MKKIRYNDIADKNKERSIASKREKKSIKEILKKTIFYLIVGLPTILPWVFFHHTPEFYETPKNTLLAFGVLISLFMWGLLVSLRKKLTIVRTKIDKPIVIYLVAFVLSTFFSIYSQSSVWGYNSRLTGGLISILILVLFFYLSVNFIRTKRKVALALNLWVGSISLLAFFTVLNSFGFFNSMFEKFVETHPSLAFLQTSVFSPVGANNILPILFIMAIPILMGFVFKYKKLQMQSLTCIVGTLLSIFAVGLTAFSGNNLYNVLISGLLVFVATGTVVFNYVKTSKLHFSTIPIILVTVFSVAFSLSSSLRDKVVKDINFSQNQTIPFEIEWSVVSGVFREHGIKGFLLGTGPDTYAYDFTRFRTIEYNSYPQWKSTYTNASNELLNVFATRGTLGLLSFLTLALSVFFFIYKYIFKKWREITQVELGIGMAVIAFFLSSIVITFQAVLWVSGILILGLLFSLYHIRNGKNDSEFSISLMMTKGSDSSGASKDVLPYVINGTLGIVILFCLFVVGKSYYSELLLKNSRVEMAWGNVGASENYILKATRLYGNRDYYHTQHAYSLLQIFFSDLSQKKKEEEVSLAIPNIIKSEINQAVELNPLNVQNWKVGAIVYKYIVEATGGEAFGDETLNAARQAIALDPYDPDNHLVLGFILQFNEDKDLQKQAGDIFYRAYVLRRDYLTSVSSLGSYFEMEGKYKQAIDLYESTLETFYKDNKEVSKLLKDKVKAAKNKRDDSKKKKEEDKQKDSPEEMQQDTGNLPPEALPEELVDDLND